MADEKPICYEGGTANAKCGTYIYSNCIMTKHKNLKCSIRECVAVEFFTPKFLCFQFSNLLRATGEEIGKENM